MLVCARHLVVVATTNPISTTVISDTLVDAVPGLIASTSNHNDVLIFQIISHARNFTGIVFTLSLECANTRFKCFNERKVSIEDIRDCLELFVQRGDVRTILAGIFIQLTGVYRFSSVQTAD